MDVWARFTGRVVAGRFCPDDLRRWEAHLLLHEGRAVEVALRKARVRRTLPQNRHIHALAQALSAHTGDSMAQIKARAVLSVLGPEDGLERMTVCGLPLVRAKSTADLDKREGAAVIDWLLQLCADLDVGPPRLDRIEVM